MSTNKAVVKMTFTIEVEGERFQTAEELPSPVSEFLVQNAFRLATDSALKLLAERKMLLKGG